jgi:2-oxo-4-hydroxy-4-carboxy--5-ureidoimidazoline (OHCU) decarboxylase
MTPLSLAAVNAMSAADFAGLRRHRRAFALGRRGRVTASLCGAAMIAAFQTATSAMPGRGAARLATHPDLAGRAAIAGDLTAD